MSISRFAIRSLAALPARTPALLLFLVVGILAFAWGALTVRHHVFPYRLAEATYTKVSRLAGSSPNRPELNRLWAKRLASGGYILHFRHAQREKWAEVNAFDAYELRENIRAESASFAKATCLTPQGVEEAKLIGHILKLASVNVSLVISSPSCRARQTALYAFGRVDGINNALLHRPAIMDSQHALFSAELRKLLSHLQVTSGSNVALLGHIFTLEPDGTAVIDVDKTGGIDERQETGFVVIEKAEGRLIAQHKFNSISEFSRATIDLPVR